MRPLILSALLLTAAVAPGDAQGFAGTWVLQGPEGVVTLTLAQERSGRATGTLEGGGSVIQLSGTVSGASLTGQATLGNRRGVFEAAVDGDQLGLVIAETNAAGVPDPSTARQLLFARSQGAALAAPSRTPGAARAGPSAGSAQDRQLTDLLLSSPWCSFSYNQRSGATNTSRNVFYPDGRLAIGTNAEGGTVNQYGGGATPSGSVYSQSQGGQVARWKVQGGQLLVDLGQGFQAVALQVSRNSNGYPIITADGTEYSQCR